MEVFGRADAAKNLALHQQADQSSLSIWPRAHPLDAVADIDWPRRTDAVLSFCERLFAWCKYDDFDGRYLPDGRVVFLPTRRGQFIQAGRESARETLTQPELPDCHVRCGGGPERPVAVYTLHVMERDGTGLCAISPFEMFEWEPSVANDGSILCARWDYIDRDNIPFMSLWSTRPDGTGTRLVYKNLSRVPHCVFEPRSIPNSDKIVFTASGHHSQTMRGAS